MNGITQARTGNQPELATRQHSRLSRLGFGVLSLLYHGFTLAPVLALGLVYLLSWYGQAAIGHWPRPVLDDPKSIVSGDWLYDSLYALAYVFLAATALSLFVLPILTLGLVNKSPRLWLLFMTAVLVIGYVIVRADPGQRFYWLLD
jgi:hypothetical protein